MPSGSILHQNLMCSICQVVMHTLTVHVERSCLRGHMFALAKAAEQGTDTLVLESWLDAFQNLLLPHYQRTSQIPSTFGAFMLQGSSSLPSNSSKFIQNPKASKSKPLRSSQSRWLSCTTRTNLSSRTMFFLSKGEGLGSCFQKQSKRAPNLDKKRTKKNGVLVALPTVCWKSRNTSQKDVPGQGVRASVNQWRCYLSRHQRNQRNPGICLWALCR